jgi:hypothetical protein
MPRSSLWERGALRCGLLLLLALAGGCGAGDAVDPTHDPSLVRPAVTTRRLTTAGRWLVATAHWPS